MLTINRKKHHGNPAPNPLRPLRCLSKHFTFSHSNLSATNWFHSLPSQRFQILLTLFPKSFSPFPHGTCLLSVSSRYLALGDNYHPFSAPLPKYATLNSAPNATESGRRKYGILTLYDAFFQKDLRPVRHWQHLSRLQFRGKPPDLQVELFPVQSPLLRESYSFSFPPLTYMLKFSGQPGLTSCEMQQVEKLISKSFEFASQRACHYTKLLSESLL